MGGPYRIIYYETERGDSPVDEFLDALDVRVRAKVMRWIGLLKEMGPDLPRPYADVVQGPIRELRIGFGHLETRLLYFFHGRTIVVVTHGFLKKAREVPVKELERALAARQNWLKQKGGQP